MTNEQLAEFIKQGGNDELLPLLWEKTHKLIYMHCSRLYSCNIERFKRHGEDEWDLKQSAYEGFLAAIKAYNPEKGYKFNTYLPYHLKNAVRRLIGVSGRKETDLLNICDSLDRPIAEDNETELSETIPDEAAIVPFEDVERADVCRVFQEEVENLPEQEKQVIKAVFFDNMTLKETGEALGGISPERVRQRKIEGLKKLRRSRAIRELYSNSITYTPRSAAACLRIGSTVETDTERREKLLRLISK